MATKTADASMVGQFSKKKGTRTVTPASKGRRSSGRPAYPEEERRTGRLSMRTYPDIEEKAKRVGTERVEAAIRRIKE